MLERLVAAIARAELGRALRFEPGSARDLPEADERPRLLYLHVPFCESLCPYCSFHRVQFDQRRAHAYFAALRREIEIYRELGWRFDAVYVGGGTPTVLPDQLEHTIETARGLFGIKTVSVETNPDHLAKARLEALVRTGVGRLSVGVQTFDDDLLKKLNRFDRCGSGRAVADRLRAVMGRFRTVNADMIFNLPGQDETVLERDLDTLLDIRPDQVTFYPLMVSDLTRRSLEETVGKVSFSREGRLYRRIVERLEPTYQRSTAWCFSRDRTAAVDEYIVDHDEYAGLGSGAIGFLGGTSYANTFDIDEYTAELKAGRTAVRSVRRFGERERVRYDFVMRLFAGRLDPAELERKHGPFGRHLWLDLAALRLAGALRNEGSELVLTERGRYYWVVLMREFFTAVNNLREYCRSSVAAD